MFLQIMTLTWDVRLDGLSRCQLDTGDFTFSRNGLFGFRNDHIDHDAFPLGVVLQEGGFGFATSGSRFTTGSLVEGGVDWGGGVEAVPGRNGWDGLESWEGCEAEVVLT